MAGVAPPSLAAAVSNAGALGTIGGAMLSPGALRAAIREVRAATEAPFGVNLFAPPYLQAGQLDVVLEERPAVFSFTFGVVDPEPMQAVGIAVLGTATTAEEAAYLEAAGVDGVSVPVIAAGGIVDGAGIRAALELGARGVQLGTAFLFTPEAGVSREHLEALRTLDTVVTPAYTGRHMRAARTPLLEELMAGPPPLPFPQQRAVAAARGPLYMGGANARNARELPVAELVATLVAEAA